MFAKYYSLVIAFKLTLCVVTTTKIDLDQINVQGKQRLPAFSDKLSGFDFNSKALNSTGVCDQAQCTNGGYCYNDVCICLPGTSGPNCNTIDGCKDLKCDNDKTATCFYDKRNFKAVCQCQGNYQEFDYEENICKECKCDTCKDDPYCLTKAVKCEFIRSQKTCTCQTPDYQYNRKTGLCEKCMCGDENVESCEFDDDGNTVCTCQFGYQQNQNACVECKCGAGNCKFVHYEKVCSCFAGHSEWKGDCRLCSCGEKGKCEFDESLRFTKCLCNPGYSEVSGNCVESKTCYCGENASCSLETGEKKCKCPVGFQTVSGLCTDINECDQPKVCTPEKKCVNTIGSYKCQCKDGFKPSEETSEKCEDINECLNANSCSISNTDCLNTVGSFECVCKSGFATRIDSSSTIVCESQTSWKLGYGLLIGAFLVVIIGLLTVLYLKSRIKQ